MNRKDKIKQCLDARLSGIQESPDTLWKVLSRAQEKENPMKKKLSFALALVLALILLGAALAAGFDVFGLFKDDEVKGKQLSQLSEFAQTYAQTTTFPGQKPTQDAPQDDYQRLVSQLQAQEIEFTLQQAYADDKTLSLSYTLSQAAQQISFGDGMPAGAFDWSPGEEGKRWTDLYSLSFEDEAQNQRAADHLNQPGGKHMIVRNMGVGDGASLLDGTDLPIEDSQVKAMEDGSIQGYMTCQIPDSVPVNDPLEIDIMVSYSAMVVYQDGEGYQTAYVRNPADQGIKHISFVIARSGKTSSLSGSISYEADDPQGSYLAQAQVFTSPINLKGSVTIKGPEAWTASWQAAFQTQDGAANAINRIFDYVLYAGDRPYPNHDGGISLLDNGDIVIGLDFDTPGENKHLSLRPVYRDGQTPQEESITLK